MTYRAKVGLRQQPPVIETLFENKQVKIDRITAFGQISPPGEFAPEPSFEFIHLLKGQLVIEIEGEADKVSLKPGEYTIKTQKQRGRADYTSVHEETVWLKVSFQGESGRYPVFTGAVGADEVHPKQTTRKGR